METKQNKIGMGTLLLCYALFLGGFLLGGRMSKGGGPITDGDPKPVVITTNDTPDQIGQKLVLGYGWMLRENARLSAEELRQGKYDDAAAWSQAFSDANVSSYSELGSQLSARAKQGPLLERPEATDDRGNIIPAVYVSEFDDESRERLARWLQGLSTGSERGAAW